MKTKIFNVNAIETGDIKLPPQFEESINPNLIKRAVIALRSSRQQPYGTFEKAGKRPSAKLSKRRRKYRTSYGYGISRVSRKIMWRRGSQFGWEAAFAPGTVGGRKAHPPKSSKDLTKKINKKERLKAIRSALAATVNPEIVSLFHKIPNNFPLILESKFELFNKTNQVKDLLFKLGLEEELKRLVKKKIRAGRGKTRGRKYKIKRGPLIVVSRKCPLEKAANNLQGFETIQVKNLNTELLSHDVKPGRLVIWTKDAINLLEKEKLFMEK